MAAAAATFSASNLLTFALKQSPGPVKCLVFRHYAVVFFLYLTVSEILSQSYWTRLTLLRFKKNNNKEERKDVGLKTRKGRLRLVPGSEVWRTSTSRSSGLWGWRMTGLQSDDGFRQLMDVWLACSHHLNKTLLFFAPPATKPNKVTLC